MYEIVDDVDLPQLQSIQLAKRALDGDDDSSMRTISSAPYNYKNTLSMKSILL